MNGARTEPEPRPAEGDRYMEIPAAATYLAVSVKTVRRIIKAGQLPIHRATGKIIRIRKSDLDFYMESRRIVVEPRPANLRSYHNQITEKVRSEKAQKQKKKTA